MQNEGWELERIQRDLETLQEQIRELKESSQRDTQTVTEQLRDLNAFVFQNVPPVVNYINNGDFVFEQEDYEPGTNYTDDHLDCAMWYQRLNSSTGQVTEHTTTVRSNDHISTNNGNQAYWVKANGEISFGTSIAIMSPLPKNLAFPAGTLYCRFQVKKTSGAITIPDAYRLRASIWDNTSGQQKIIEGAVFDISASPAVSAPGSFSRNYILRIDTNMDFFYSDVITPVQVTNQVSVTNIDNVNFVNVSWQVFPESISYKLYRFDSEFSEWRQIAEIRNGATSFRDVGGRTGALFSLPGANILPRAQALFVNFGEYVSTDYKDVIFNIFVPTTYNFGNTTDKQWIRIDMVDENLNFVTIADEALLIDKLSVGYTNGRFTYSSRDLVANAAIQATTPPPVPPPGGQDGGGGGTPPEPGGGGSGGAGCVKPDTKILMAVGNAWFWQRADKISVGDVVANGLGLTSVVTKIIKAHTNQLRVITTENGRQLWCSPSHSIVQSSISGATKPAHKLKNGDPVVTIGNNGYIESSTISAIEIINVESDVLTFTLEGERTYIADGIVSHNLKPILTS